MIRPLIALLTAVLVIGGCQTTEDSLSQNIPCSTNEECATDQTCLIDRCIGDETIAADETCTEDTQCEAGMVCYGFVCTPGCSDVYHTSDCNDDLWCKPRSHEFFRDENGHRSMVGQCIASECDPGFGTGCDPGLVCAAITQSIGGCVEPCEYGFVGNSYQDDCQQENNIEHKCHPIGLNHAPTCLPEGDLDGPAVGSAGCDPIRNPCAPGAICINIVCRKLCQSGQNSPCNNGESCIQLSDRANISYCRNE